MSLRKATAVILAVTMIAALSGCGGSGQESGNSDSGSAAQAETTENTETEPEAESETSTDTETRDSLVITIPGDPTTLAPNGASASGYTVPQIYDQLWNLTDGELIMRVAAGYEQEDETHYVVTIQSGIKDTAGNEIKASDVLYSDRKSVV